MKKVLIALLLAVSLLVTLVACEPNETPEPHRHTYEQGWTSDADYHWHKATCEHTDQIDGKAAHDFKPAVGRDGLECSVCKYFKATPPAPHTHTYATELSSDENGHWYAATCEHTDQITVNPHSYVDGICTECGWWKSATDVLIANVAKSDIWNYTVLLDDVKVSGIKTAADAEAQTLTVSGEIKLALSSDGKLSGQGGVTVNGVAYKAVIKDNVLYAVGDGTYFRSGLGDLLVGAGLDMTALQGYIDEINAQTQQIRSYVEQIELIPDDGAASELLALLLKVNQDKSTADTAVYSFDTALLRALNAKLAQTTVAEYVNAVLGTIQGTPLGALLGDDIADLPVNVAALWSAKLGVTLSRLVQDGYSLDELVAQLDGFVRDYYPDPAINTVDQLLAELGVDLNGVSFKQAILAASVLSPETIWNSMNEENVANQITARQLSDKISALITAYGDKTVYDIIGESVEMTAADVKTLVDDAADLLDECLSVEFYVDKAGTLQRVEVAVSPGQSADVNPAFAQLIELLNGTNGTIAFERDHTLGVDCSTVIADVNAYYASLTA